MAVKPTVGQKGTSPSKLIQRGNDQAWGAQQGVGTTAQQALAKKWTKQPYPVKGNGK